MKTTFAKLFLVATAVILLLGSCASQHRCEAYSDAHHISANSYASIK